MKKKKNLSVWRVPGFRRECNLEKGGSPEAPSANKALPTPLRTTQDSNAYGYFIELRIKP
jgi:hypothetical protein